MNKLSGIFREIWIRWEGGGLYQEVWNTFNLDVSGVASSGENATRLGQ
jgi:hypothetical protein